MAHDSKLNIYQRLSLVALAVPYVKKEVESGSGGKGVARDLVVATVRKHLLDNGVYFSTSQVGDGQYVQTGSKSAKGSEKVTYIGRYRTSFINTDVPSDRHEVEHSGQGDDYGDKAPGKSSTYAEKLNIIKGLGLETGIADEGRYSDEYKTEGVEPAKPSIGEERLANFCKSLTAAGTTKEVNETWKMAKKFIDENGGNPADIEAITEAGSKRKGVLKEKAEASAAAK